MKGTRDLWIPLLILCSFFYHFLLLRLNFPSSLILFSRSFNSCRDRDLELLPKKYAASTSLKSHPLASPEFFRLHLSLRFRVREYFYKYWHLEPSLEITSQIYWIIRRIAEVESCVKGRAWVAKRRGSLIQAVGLNNIHSQKISYERNRWG